MEKKMFDLCFHPGQGMQAIDWFIEIKKEFEKVGISVMAFTMNTEIGKAWHEKGMHDYIVLPDYKDDVDIPKAASFVKFLGISNFRSLYQTEQIFWDLPEDFCQRKMAAYIHALEELREAPKAKFYWTYGGDEFDHNCLRLLSRMHGGKTIYSQPINMKGRMAIFENEDRYWKIPSETVLVPDNKEIKWIRDYITDYIAKKTILWGDPAENDIKWRWNYPVRLIKRLGRSWKNREINPQSTNSFKIRQWLIRSYNRYFSNRYYADPAPFINGVEQFVYFPLHYPKDSQLTLRGKPFLDQASIVKTVAMYVPYPYTLIVKEHPHARGFYSVSDIKRMAALPFVKLLHPFTNSHNLIPNAKGIIAINSSVGYEGIIYQKPVITMGKSFYRGQGLTIDVESLYELEKAFESMERFSLSENDVISFLWKMKKFSYPIDDYFNLSNENAKNLVFAFKQFTNQVL